MRKLVIVAVLGVLVAVGADRLALRLAESAAADGIKRAQGLTLKPQVSIEGFPFLTQLASGHYTAISIAALGTGGSDGAQSVRISSWRARATQLRTDRSFSHVTAGSVSGTATIGYADLTSALAQNETLSATASFGGQTPDGHGRISITGTLSVLGQKLRGTVSAELVIAAPNKLGFTAVRVQGLSLPQSLVSVFTDAFTKQLTVTELPPGLQLTRILSSPAGVTGDVRGSNVVLKQ